MMIPLFLVVALMGSTLSFRMNGPSSRMNQRSSLVMKDFKKPNVENTENFRVAEKLSKKFATLKGKGESKTVAIIGGGLSGLAAARYLVDAGKLSSYLLMYYERIHGLFCPG